MFPPGGDPAGRDGPARCRGNAASAEALAAGTAHARDRGRRLAAGRADARHEELKGSPWTSRIHPRRRDLQAKVSAFMQAHVVPAEAAYEEEVAANRRAGDPWKATRVVESPQGKRRARRGSGIFFLPESELGAGSHQPRVRAALRDHGAARRSGPESFQLQRARTPATWKCWCATARPSRRSSGCSRSSRGRIRSGFAMTEPRGRLVGRDQYRVAHRARTAADYVINGRKWWDPRARRIRVCKVLIFMGKTSPKT